MNHKSRDELHRDVQMVAAGQPVGVVLAALTDSLAAAIAFASEDLPGACRMVDSLSGDLKRSIADNWTYIRTLRADPAAGGSRA